MDDQTVEPWIQHEATPTDQCLLMDDHQFSSRTDNPQPASHRCTVQVVWDHSSTPQQIEPPLCICYSQPPRMENNSFSVS